MGKNNIFVKAKDKYSDMRSSAICLIGVGLIGVSVILLDYLNVFPIKLNANNSFIFYFAMTALFVIFIVSGIYTMVSAKKVKDSISDEESLTDTIVAWALDNITSEQIDNELDDFSELPDEVKYLSRAESLGKIIETQFDIHDEAYISTVVDEIYPELFE